MIVYNPVERSVAEGIRALMAADAQGGPPAPGG